MDIVKQNVGSIILYLILINLAGFVMMGLDKSYAQKGKWRIKERSFFIVSLVGGSLGTIFGMYKFRHKTKHGSFTVGIPAILAIQLGLIINQMIKG